MCVSNQPPTNLFRIAAAALRGAQSHCSYDPNMSTEDTQPKKWNVMAEDQVRKQFLKEARDKCKPEIEAFVKCAKEHGLFVTFKCRELLMTSNACVAKHTSDEQYVAYRDEKKRRWIEEGRLRDDTPPTRNHS